MVDAWRTFVEEMRSDLTSFIFLRVTLGMHLLCTTEPQFSCLYNRDDDSDASVAVAGKAYGQLKDRPQFTSAKKNPTSVISWLCGLWVVVSLCSLVNQMERIKFSLPSVMWGLLGGLKKVLDCRSSLKNQGPGWRL